MTSLDTLKHFAIVEFVESPGIYGIAFAVLRENTDVFLVATTSLTEQENNKNKNIYVSTIHRSNIQFQHYSKWDSIFKQDQVVKSFQYAYHSSQEDWPCGFVRAHFIPTQTVS